jgi:RNA recognition motif-containing protein
MAEQDADYAVKIMNQIKLFGKPIRVNKASYDQKKPIDIGANLFIGSLDESVDEGQMYETFQTFGSLVEQPKVSSLHQLDVPYLWTVDADSRYREILRLVQVKDMDSFHSTISKLPIWLLRI